MKMNEQLMSHYARAKVFWLHYTRVGIPENRKTQSRSAMELKAMK
jgi:hypothetical protein